MRHILLVIMLGSALVMLCSIVYLIWTMPARRIKREKTDAYLAYIRSVHDVERAKQIARYAGAATRRKIDELARNNSSVS
jgi:NADH:ubiquinone oxidoreductase subunit 3 (subunit A)